MQLHHCSHQVAEDSLELVAELFTTKLGFREVFRLPYSVFLRQSNSMVDIQLKGSSPIPAQTGKRFSHIAFISDTPGEAIQELQDWFRKRGHDCETGQYGTDMELWFDVPRVFLDFVIEVIHTQLIKDHQYPSIDKAE